MLNDFFKGSKPDRERLLRYGFREEKGALCYRVPLLDFTLLVTVRGEETRAELFDEFGEPYTLHLVDEAEGEFVDKVREAYARACDSIERACFRRDVFVFELTKALIERVAEKYGDEPEYLWEKFPDNAVFRRKDNAKWYGAILTTEREKIGMKGKGKIEVLDVRADPREVPLLVDGEKIFGGWHMNKKHWISLPLDGTLSLEEVEEFLEESRLIAASR